MMTVSYRIDIQMHENGRTIHRYFGTLDRKGQLEIISETDIEEGDFVHDQGLLFVFRLRRLNSREIY
jgi:hypothetical protein